MWVLSNSGSLFGACDIKKRSVCRAREDQSDNGMAHAPKCEEVKSFMGLIGYYWRFVWHFSKIGHPISALQIKGEKF